MELISVGHPTPKHKQFSVIHILLCESIKKWQMVDIHIKKRILINLRYLTITFFNT